MAKNYSDWLNAASKHKTKLDQALRNGDAKNILYYRGKYIFDLKQAYKLNSSGIVPSSITGATSSLPIDTVINTELANHQAHIDVSIQNNKQTTSKKGPSITKEIGLKIKKLSTRVSQANFATNATVRDNAKKGAVKDSLSLTGSTLVKAPVMATAKVVSKVGPLAISIVLLPASVFNFLLATTIDISTDNVGRTEYNNTFVSQLSKPLKDGVRDISNSIHKNVGKI